MFIYNRSQRIRFGIGLLCIAIMVLIFSAVFAAQLWRLPNTKMTGYDPGYLNAPSRNTLIPTYGLPPILTIMLLTSELAVYQFMRPRNPLVYGVVSTAIMVAGWLVTTIIWAHCHVGNKHAGSDPNAWPSVCYQARLADVDEIHDQTGDGVSYLTAPRVSEGVAVFLILTTVFFLTIYVSYLSITVQDLYRYRRRQASNSSPHEDVELPELKKKESASA